MKVLHVYTNVEGDTCTWIEDDSSVPRMVQWSETLKVHRTAKSLIDYIKSAEFESVVETES